jgi:hypothetical protein
MWGEYKPTAEAENVVPYVPAVSDMLPATDEDVFRMLVAQHHDTIKQDNIKALDLSLILAAAGRPEAALLQAHLSEAVTRGGDGYWKRIARIATEMIAKDCNPDFVKKARAGWDYFPAGRGFCSNYADSRLKALKTLNKRDDLEGLWALAFDTDREVSMAACSLLRERGEGNELERYLALSAEIEHKLTQGISPRGVPKSKDADAAPIIDTEELGNRGKVLVARAIKAVEEGTGYFEVAIPEPVPARVFDKLAFPNGETLPQSLKQWLAYDSSWMVREGYLLEGGKTPRFSIATMARLVHGFRADTPAWKLFMGLKKPLSDTYVLPLDSGSESIRVLFLALPDDQGEYPVLNLGFDDEPIITLYSPGFDTWLAQQAGLLSDATAEYPETCDSIAKRLFGKEGELVCRGRSRAKEPKEWLETPASKRKGKGQRAKKTARGPKRKLGRLE